MSKLITTNIRIPEEEYLWYKAIAQSKGESFASLVRNSLKKVVGRKKLRTRSKRSLWEIERYAIKIRKGKTRGTIDETIYSSPHGR